MSMKADSQVPPGGKAVACVLLLHVSVVLLGALAPVDFRSEGWSPLVAVNSSGFRAVSPVRRALAPFGEPLVMLFCVLDVLLLLVPSGWLGCSFYSFYCLICCREVRSASPYLCALLLSYLLLEKVPCLPVTGWLGCSFCGFYCLICSRRVRSASPYFCALLLSYLLLERVPCLPVFLCGAADKCQ